ncbi:MAG: NYN domain-containing protein, partial [Minisyncoccia bacterium]
MNKIYAFIDSQNINLGTQEDIFTKTGALVRKGWKIDFDKFINYLKTKFNVNQAFLFIGYIPENQALYTDLQKKGFILVFKPILKYKDSDGKEKVKGNVDAELVLHSMIEFLNYDKAIIASGDGDFFCLIEYLQKSGKLLKILTPNAHYSS